MTGDPSRRRAAPRIGGLDVGEIHHVAMVVPDLAAGMKRFAETLGLRWADPWTGEIPILVAGRLRTPVVSFTLTLGGRPHLELIQSTDQSTWRPGGGLDHFGYWVDDVDAAVAVVVAAGFTAEVVSPTADFAYVRSPDGARIEFVDRRSAPDFARWLGGGRL